MTWNIGDIAIVHAEHDPQAHEMLFYLLEISDDIASGYLIPGGMHSDEHTPYSCPISKISRVARAILFQKQ
jgi:hypothetical protein